MMIDEMKNWWKSGTPWIWLNAGAVSISLLLVIGILGMIMVKGMGHFWVSDVYEMHYNDTKNPPRTIIGERVETADITVKLYEEVESMKAPADTVVIKRVLIKSGNRDQASADFQWIFAHHIEQQTTPEQLIKLERLEWGNFYGYLKNVQQQGEIIAAGDEAWHELNQRFERVQDLHEELKTLEKDEISSINYGLERLRLKKRKLELDKKDSPENLQLLTDQENAFKADYEIVIKRLNLLREEIKRDSASFIMANGKDVTISLHMLVSILKPNQMGVMTKLAHYVLNFYHFIFEDPREANTEGGVFPAIFGTVMMVILMSVLVTPFGVIAAVYLREYARQGPLIRLIRIAVNNLAGVPSIVYGVFGLGFFVYFLGGNIDQLFYPEALPAPTYGTPGLVWAALTLALLTVPVVIVSTEEGLARIPKNLREGSLALGATKAETLWRVILPMSSPAIMTGLILAVARAAGEVAPLMLVGVVKLAPELPLDDNFPFLHMERKFMHLGFHIYDVGFQSPNVEAARPLVYATAFLLVLVIVLLNLSAIMLRNRLREKYKALDA
ncbi:MAG: phosphate ABC transporter permease PstA [Gammaproteobacteria bacterium]|nr:phosphate ABC transporter permease PstA [Gammaproteobacteria bacterium]